MSTEQRHLDSRPALAGGTGDDLELGREEWVAVCPREITPEQWRRFEVHRARAHPGPVQADPAGAAVRPRLTVQERIGQQLADALDRILEPHGVAVHLEAVHLCTQMRGVREIESSTRTTYWRGNYDEDPDLRAGFFRLCGQTASAELLTVRRHGSYLFLRYALHGTPPPAEPSGG